MTKIFLERISSAINSRLMKVNFLTIFLLLFLYQTTSGQICDKKTMVFFESDQYSISSSEEGKLRSLSQQFSQKTDTFLLEIYAFTDSVASTAYNLKLAENRFKSIVNYLKKNSQSHFEIVERVMGEASPMSSNATEAGRAKNRRVEIFYFRKNGNNITLKGKGGMEMLVAKNYFAPRGICECQPKFTEIYTNAEAAQAGIDLTTADGCPLTTGGMISMSFEGQDANGCADVIIRIPGDKYDKDMEIWNSSAVGRTAANWVREPSSQLEYDELTKYYTLSVKYCPGSNINLDKLTSLGCRDSSAVISIPELTRSRKVRNYRITKSTVLTKEGVSSITIAKFRYSGMGQINFADSGMTNEKIGYYFSGMINKYLMECDSARCSRMKECWCYEVPLSAYTKIIYFRKKQYQLKIPMKYKNYSVNLFIPAADTLLPLSKVEGTKRTYSFMQPLPNTYLVFYKDVAAAKNKRAYDYQIDLEMVKKKFSEGEKVHKAKIKRRQLKKAA